MRLQQQRQFSMPFVIAMSCHAGFDDDTKKTAQFVQLLKQTFPQLLVPRLIGAGIASLGFRALDRPTGLALQDLPDLLRQSQLSAPNPQPTHF